MLENLPLEDMCRAQLLATTDQAMLLYKLPHQEKNRFKLIHGSLKDALPDGLYDFTYLSHDSLIVTGTANVANQKKDVTLYVRRHRE